MNKFSRGVCVCFTGLFPSGAKRVIKLYVKNPQKEGIIDLFFFVSVGSFAVFFVTV